MELEYSAELSPPYFLLLLLDGAELEVDEDREAVAVEVEAAAPLLEVRA